MMQMTPSCVCMYVCMYVRMYGPVYVCMFVCMYMDEQIFSASENKLIENTFILNMNRKLLSQSQALKHACKRCKNM